jgi:hypothetical protein
MSKSMRCQKLQDFALSKLQWITLTWASHNPKKNSWAKHQETTAAQWLGIWTSRTTTWYYKAWPSNSVRACHYNSQCQTTRWTSSCPSKSSNWTSNYKVTQWTLIRATSSIRRKISTPKTQASAMATKPHLNNNRPSKRLYTQRRTNKCSTAHQLPSCSKTKYERALARSSSHETTWRNLIYYSVAKL